MNSCGVPQAAPIQNEPMPGRRGYAGEKVLCIPVLLPRVARELLPARGGGRMALPSFFYGVRQENFPTEGIPLAQIRKKMRRGENLLPVPHSYQGSPENCLHRRWFYRQNLWVGV